MKVSVNYENDTISFKGMSTDQFAVINTLLAHTRLGNTGGETAAFEILEAIETSQELLDEMWISPGSLRAVNESGRKVLNDPTLEVTLDEEDEQ